MPHTNALNIDIKEDYILRLSRELLATLLLDHTTGKNIFWGTNNYAERGFAYQYDDPITIEAITGKNGNVIVPRAVKSRTWQQLRSREMAEVFTPSWVCNRMNNCVDEAWFGRHGVFNTEIENEGKHEWIVNTEPIYFPEGKSWEDYIKENRLEITCGEAPYLVSRYDTVSGEPISIDQRIGLLDRKLRIVGENTTTPDEWLKGTQMSYKSSYGYEWQGDNLLLAREALLFTFIDYYRAKFNQEPPLDAILNIAHIISWNIWQMDGLKGVIPNSCEKDHVPEMGNMFGDDIPNTEKEKKSHCMACKTKRFWGHIGIECKIMDWERGTPILFTSLYNKKG